MIRNYHKSHFIFLFSLLTWVGTLAQQPVLKEYTCLTKFISVEGWEKEKNVGFDGACILKVQERYHPLSITQYGIVNYYRFLETGDSGYLDRFLSQVSYFKDPSKVNLLHNGKSIGLPYTFLFQDLKAPWYSGMTQGSAISFLLRYFEFSRDSTILPTVRKIAHLMLLPEQQGGAISKTPEGLTWIEEYPNSKRSRHVLNGFINAWIGLYEYCLFFPDDTLAFRICDESYYALTHSLDKYEGINGALYNRSKSYCTNSYVRYQILEMEQLYELTREEIFRRQMMAWSHMIYKKPNMEKGARILFKDFDFVVPLKKSYEMMPEKLFQPLAESVYKSISINERNLGKEDMRKVFSAKADSAFLYEPVKTRDRKQMNVAIVLNDTLRLDRMVLTTHPMMNIHAGFRIAVDSGRICIDLREHRDQTIRVESKSDRKINSWSIHDLKIYPPSTHKIPYFAFYLSKIIPPRKPLDVVTQSKFAGDPVVFYRSHADSARVEKLHWKVLDSYSMSEGPKPGFQPDYAFYQILVIFEVRGPETSVTSIKIGETKEQ